MNIEKPKLPESHFIKVTETVDESISKSLQARIDQFVYGADKLQSEQISLDIEKVKQELEQLKEAVREYLKRSSTDGAPVRQELHKKLAELVKEG